MAKSSGQVKSPSQIAGLDPFPQVSPSSTACSLNVNHRKIPRNAQINFQEGEKFTHRTFFSGRTEHCAKKEVRGRKGRKSRIEKERNIQPPAFTEFLFVPGTLLSILSMLAYLLT